MTQSRTPSNHPFPLSENIAPTLKCIITGFIVGPITATVTFPGDKILAIQKTKRLSKPPTAMEIIKEALRHPACGYPTSVFCSTLKYMFVFPVKTGFEWFYTSYTALGSSMSDKLACLSTGVMTGYIFNGMSTAKILGCTGKSVKQILKFKLTDLSRRGMHPAAMGVGVHYGIFFGSLAHVTSYTINLTSYSFLDRALAGSLTALLSATASEPLHMIAVNNKANGTKMMEEAISLYKTQGGPARFYRGFGMTLFRMSVLQGPSLAWGMDVAEKTNHHLFAKK